MTSYKFNVGDRVAYTGKGYPGLANGSAVGHKGTVVNNAGGVVEVKWDGGNDYAHREHLLSSGVFPGNVELLVEAGADRFIKVGTCVTYRGALDGLNEKTAKVMRFYNAEMAVVQFDHEARDRVVALKSLFTIPQGESTMKNLKVLVNQAISKLIAPVADESVKEQAVRRLGVASEIVKLGEADKKKAKAELTTLGIITGGEQNGVVFDSPRYVMTATTKAASSRLDAAALATALNNEGLSQAMQRRIVAAATVTSKAATSFTVEAK